MTVQMEDIYQEAEEFIRLFYDEGGKSEAECKRRLADISKEINETGTYTHTYEELSHGARVAWRNSNRCIGRLFWESMHVLDQRQLSSENEIAEAIFDHIEYATNKGKVIPTISIFKQRKEGGDPVRILNHQLVRYAGYESDGGVVGDPDSIEFTKYCQSLGWRGAGTNYDILPLVIQVDEKEPKWFSIPERCVLEVEIAHPTITSISDLNIKWYGVPFVSDMKLEIGGITYPAAPFNGWYMGTEIGARNLADDNRYDLLPDISDCMNLERMRDSTLWKDRALLELNVAVLSSFKLAGVSIVDHHTAAKQFERFREKEEIAGREVNGKWSWLIPPLAPATTKIFHTHFNDQVLKPNYFYQERLY